MKIKHWIATAAMLAACAAQAAPQARWTITAIPFMRTPGGDTPLGINNRGQVVGYGTVTDPSNGGTSFHAFMWDNGTMMDLGKPSTSVSPFSSAFAINDRGTVAAGDGMDNAYEWQDGTWTALGFQGSPRAVNRFDTFTGWYRPGHFLVHGYTYRDGVFTDIGTLGGEFSQPYAINDKGVVVGKSLLADNFTMHPFAWQAGVMTDLGTFGGRFGVAQGTNNHGEIVGAAWDAASRSHAFIYDGAMRMLFPDDTRQSQAIAINDHGAIIGTFGTIDTSFLYEDGVLTMLEQIPAVHDAGWSWLVPTAINDRGWITGYARKDGNSTVGFVLMPK